MSTQRPSAARSDATPPPRQRRFLRAAVDLAARYVVGSETSERDGSVRDLGGGGLRLSSADDLAPGTGVTVRFSLPADGTDVTVAGRIVMSFLNGTTKRFEHGIAFTQIEAGRQAAVVAYIQELSPGAEPG